MIRNPMRIVVLMLLVGLVLAACAAEAPLDSPVATQAPATAAVTEAPLDTPAPAATELPAVTEPAATQPPAQDQRPETPTAGPTTSPRVPQSAQDMSTLQKLQSTAWILRSYRDASGAMQQVPAGERGTAVFGPEQVNGTSFCNSYFASYQVEGSSLAITQPGSTMMACMPPRGDLEQIYLQRLVQAASFELAGQQLIIRDQAGEDILVFEADTQAAVPGQNNPALVPEGLQRDDLANALYRTGFTINGTAQLKDGVYEEPGPAGSNSTNTVRLAEQPVAYGRLPDGQAVAAVVTGSNTGGSGTFYELHLMGQLDNAQPVDLAFIFLGDRVRVNSIQFVEDGRMVVDMIVQGPNDPMCCPSMQQFLNVEYANGELLVEVQPDTVSATAPAGGTVAPQAPVGAPGAQAGAGAGLQGVVWRWTEFQDASGQTQPVNQPERYLVEFLPDNGVRVQADCNSGSGRYSLQGDQLKIEGIALTKMLCPPGSLSDRFVQSLSAAVSYTLQADTLLLTLNNGAGIMKLTPAP